MDISSDPEVLLGRQRTNLLRDLGTAATASQAVQQRSAVVELGTAVINLRSINTSLTPPLDPYRGRNLDILA